MKKILFICLMILGLAVSCASTGDGKNEDEKVNPGEIMEHEKQGR